MKVKIMSQKLFAQQAFTKSGWQQNITIKISSDGIIKDTAEDTPPLSASHGAVLPALANVLSHSFQCAMAGLEN